MAASGIREMRDVDRSATIGPRGSELRDRRRFVDRLLREREIALARIHARGAALV